MSQVFLATNTVVNMSASTTNPSTGSSGTFILGVVSTKSGVTCSLVSDLKKLLAVPRTLLVIALHSTATLGRPCEIRPSGTTIPISTVYEQTNTETGGVSHHVNSQRASPAVKDSDVYERWPGS